MRTRIKVCGLTTPADAQAVVATGVDAVGLVFYAPSPRAVSVAQAQAICRVLPPFVTVVGLFVNEARRTIEDVLESVPLNCLQFHGDESPEDCAGYGIPFLKVARVQSGLDLVQFAARYDNAQGVLVDAFVPGVPGGTGQTFDWSLVPPMWSCPWVLSGGLTGDNVAAAVRQLRPWAVDVSSGVEEAPGRKSLGAVERFVAAVKAADDAME